MPIFDQGYQHWNGPLSGHAWRWLVVARHGVRTQLKGKIVRLLLLTAWIPALALVVALAVWGLLEQQAESVLAFLRPLLPADVIAQPRDYRSAVWTIAFSFFFHAEMAFSLFLVMIVGPNLISRDLRMNALPLYFSRPLRRIDYFLGKLGVIGFYLAAIAIVPAAVAYVVGVAFSLDLGVVRDTHRLLWAGTLYGLIITISAGTLMLALSSLSRRSIYVGLAWAGFCLLTGMVSSVLIAIRFETERHHSIQDGITRWVADHPPPQGLEMFGPYPRRRFGPRGTEAAFSDAQERWMTDWSRAYQRIRDQADQMRNEESRRDWRPICSYPSNLNRLGDWLLDTDSAWVVIGRTVERPRAAFAPVAAMRAGGRLPKELMQPANERLLADQVVWQFPWYWSAGVLGGLLLLSTWILTMRVKHLDRLK